MINTEWHNWIVLNADVSKIKNLDKWEWNKAQNCVRKIKKGPSGFWHFRFDDLNGSLAHIEAEIEEG